MRTFKCQMTHLIARQEDSPPRYTRVVEEAPRLDSFVRNIPGGELNGLNRGTRRQPPALQWRLGSARSFSLSMKGGLSECQ